MTTDHLGCVLAAFSEVLKTTVGPEDDFFALGGDSLGSETLLTLISAETGLDLPGWALLDYPRPVDLVGFMAGLQACSANCSRS